MMNGTYDWPQPMHNDRLTIDLDAVRRIGICVDSCPTDVLRMACGGQEGHDRLRQRCQACYLCQDDCPHIASPSASASRIRAAKSIYDLLGIA